MFGQHLPPVTRSPDLARVLALPRRPRVEPGSARAEALIEHTVQKYGRGPRECQCSVIQKSRKILPKPCIKRPNYVQAWALHEISLAGGLVGNIAVGCGKTFIDVMAPLAFANCRVAVLLVPSTLVDQLFTEYLLIAEHFRVPTISLDFGPDNQEGGRNCMRRVPGAPVLRVLPYSHFQRAKATVHLETIRPDVIIADECQNLASMDSTRSSRFLRYYAAHGDVTRLAAYSGTLTDDEIQDYAHHLAIALRDGSPLPLVPEVVEEWGTAINPEERVAPAGALEAFCEPGEHVQDGYYRRLTETLGVVATTGASIEAELEIKERKPPPLPDAPLQDARAPGVPALGVERGWWPGVQTCLDYLRQTWRRPDGELLVDALSFNRCARELACGVFLRWKFIHGETRSQVEEYYLARGLWHEELRDKLQRRLPHLDSPMLCANAARRAWGTAATGDTDEYGHVEEVEEDHPDLPRWRAESWPRWAAIKDVVRPVTEAVRLDPFLARDAAAWAKENRGIVWYYTVALGEWISELSGLPLHGGGLHAGEKLAEERGDRSIVCSIKSHGTGRDGLQRLFATQLVTQPPASAVAWEQLLGRLSRIGQEASTVSAWIYRHTAETKASVDSALRKALYCQRTTGAPQKLRAGWHVE